MRFYSSCFLFLLPLLLLACTSKPASRKTVRSQTARAPRSAEAPASPDRPPVTTSQGQQSDVPRPVMGAEQMNAYLPALKGKRVAMVVNHTSMVGNTHLVDTLLSGGIAVKKIFAPEHGFRGEAAAGG